jgi:hypothetical protein
LSFLFTPTLGAYVGFGGFTTTGGSITPGAAIELGAFFDLISGKAANGLGYGFKTRIGYLAPTLNVDEGHLLFSLGASFGL